MKFAIQVLAAVAFASACSKKEEVSRSPDNSPSKESQPAQVQAQSPRVAATADWLRTLDTVRAQAFQPGLQIPERPAEPVADPGTTAFAASEGQKAYEAALRDYKRQAHLFDSKLNAYMKTFQRDWEVVSLRQASTRSMLDQAVNADGGAPSDAYCKVKSVEGRCEKVCMKLWSDIGLERVPAARCRAVESMDGRPAVKQSADPNSAYWAQYCHADFTCAVSPSISLAASMLAYDADAFHIKFEKTYDSADAEKIASETFQPAIGRIKPGAEVRFPQVQRWRFVRSKEGSWWEGDVRPDDGFPEVK